MIDDIEIKKKAFLPGKELTEFTPARVQLGQTGVSLPTRHHLEFQLALAHARDAVYAELSVHSLANELKQFGLPVMRLTSAAPDRRSYLRRPDLGRRLSTESETLLAARGHPAAGTQDVAFVVADGLSALAIERHAVALLREMLPRLSEWKIAPICIVEQGRVAVGDAVGAALGAAMTVVLIGERPGLSSPDSLGAYLTWEPRVGRSDAERNCVSNIRAEGLSYRAAAETIVYLMRESRALQLSGVALKEAAQVGAIAEKQLERE